MSKTTRLSDTIIPARMDRRTFLGGAAAGLLGLSFAFPIGAREPVRPGPAPHSDLAMQPASGARTFHLNSNAGNDEQAGDTPATAWRTLERASREILRPGDRLLLCAGCTFSGSLAVKGAGALVEGAPRPVLIDRYGEGPAPHIAGGGFGNAALALENNEYIEVRNLEISNTGEEESPRRHGVSVRLRDFGTARHIVLENLHIHDVNGSRVKQQGGGGAISFSGGGRGEPSRYDGLRIENCLLQRCTRNGINSGGITQRDRWFPHLNVVIRGNVLEEIPGDGIVPIGCDGALIEHNIMRNCPDTLPQGEAAAGIWPWSSDNTVIQYNTVSDHKAPWDAQGFDADWNCRNTVIQYNYSHDNWGGFVLVCDKGDTRGNSSVGNQNPVVRYNISFNDGLRPNPSRESGNTIFSPIFHLTGGLTGTSIYNNLVICPAKPSDKIMRRMVDFDNWGGPFPEDTIIANNIFMVAETTDWNAGRARNSVIENNIFAGPFEGIPNREGNLTGELELEDRPETAPASRDDLAGLRPKLTSSAIGAGKRMPEHAAKDFWGNPIAGDAAINIGPYQG